MIKSVQNTGNASNAVFYGDNDSSSTKTNRKNRININFESAKKTPAPERS